MSGDQHTKVQKLSGFKSSNVQAATYDPTKKVAQVTFKNGDTYAYSSISSAAWRGFDHAKSKGGFVYSHFAKKHEAVKL